MDHPYDLLKENFIITGREDAVSTMPVEEESARLAQECARTLFMYYTAETVAARYEAWQDHLYALGEFNRLRPRLADWEQLAHPTLMRAIEANRP